MTHARSLFSPHPLDTPDESFHRLMTEVLENWSTFHRPKEVVRLIGEQWALQYLVLQDTASTTTEMVPAAAHFVLIGGHPHTGWLPPVIKCDERGFIVTGNELIRDQALHTQWPLDRPPWLFEISIPSVFAVGDVRHRSAKRVATAVGEGATAIMLVHEYLSEQ